MSRPLARVISGIVNGPRDLLADRVQRLVRQPRAGAGSSGRAACVARRSWGHRDRAGALLLAYLRKQGRLLAAHGGASGRPPRTP